MSRSTTCRETAGYTVCLVERLMESRMQGNLHVRFGGGPTVPLALRGRDHVAYPTPTTPTFTRSKAGCLAPCVGRRCSGASAVIYIAFPRCGHPSMSMDGSSSHHSYRALFFPHRRNLPNGRVRAQPLPRNRTGLPRKAIRTVCPMVCDELPQEREKAP